MDAIEQTVEIPAIGVTLEADMTMPAPGQGSEIGRAHV